METAEYIREEEDKLKKLKEQMGALRGSALLWVMPCPKGPLCWEIHI